MDLEKFFGWRQPNFTWGDEGWGLSIFCHLHLKGSQEMTHPLSKHTEKSVVNFRGNSIWISNVPVTVECIMGEEGCTRVTVRYGTVWYLNAVRYGMITFVLY